MQEHREITRKQQDEIEQMMEAGATPSWLSWNDKALTSIAISLKRIADRLDPASR
jgi:hypothetical protein